MISGSSQERTRAAGLIEILTTVLFPRPDEEWRLMSVMMDRRTGVYQYLFKKLLEDREGGITGLGSNLDRPLDRQRCYIIAASWMA